MPPFHVVVVGTGSFVTALRGGSAPVENSLRGKPFNAANLAATDSPTRPGERNLVVEETVA